MTDMFNGALDRFDWKLVGKKEMYIPYNSYKPHRATTKVSDADPARATSTPTTSATSCIACGWSRPSSSRASATSTAAAPSTSTRTAGRSCGIDHYDGQGKLWRYSEALPINYYEVPTLWTTLETHHDLKSGRYISGLLDNQDKPRDFSFQSTPADYSPQNLRDSGIR